MLHFYAQRKVFKDGAGVTPANYYYSTREEAERQYHLLCASAIANTDGNDFVAVEYGTVEQGAVERRFWDFRVEAAEEVV